MPSKEVIKDSFSFPLLYLDKQKTITHHIMKETVKFIIGRKVKQKTVYNIKNR